MGAKVVAGRGLEALSEALSGAERPLVVGVGNPMLGDDGVGPAVTRALSGEGLSVLDVGEAPEMHLHRIRAASPDLVIFVDAVHFGGEPGEARVFEPGELSDFTVSCHRVPLRALSRYIEVEVGARVLVVGIQPSRLGFGLGLSEEAEGTVRKVVEAVKRGAKR